MGEIVPVRSLEDFPLDDIFISPEFLEYLESTQTTINGSKAKAKKKIPKKNQHFMDFLVSFFPKEAANLGYSEGWSTFLACSKHAGISFAAFEKWCKNYPK